MLHVVFPITYSKSNVHTESYTNPSNLCSYSGSGSEPKPAPVVISKTNNILNSVYCDMSNYPNFVQDYTVKYNYDAYFTGDLNLTVLDKDVQNMNSKLVGYLGSESGLCDTVQCTPNSVSCVAHYTKSKLEKALMGASKNTTDVIRTQYLCEQPKPLKQLPLFNRYACIPVSGSLTVSLSKTLSQTEVETAVFQGIKLAMESGDLNTPNQIIGLVYAPKASTTINTTGKIVKKMRPIGIGFLTAGLVRSTMSLHYYRDSLSLVFSCIYIYIFHVLFL